ncbi:MAG: alpha/beta fold hydrolase [Acidimicrobiales bacterium]
MTIPFMQPLRDAGDFLPAWKRNGKLHSVEEARKVSEVSEVSRTSRISSAPASRPSASAQRGKLLALSAPSIDTGGRRIRHAVRMVHNVFLVEGRRLRYAVSDNYDDVPVGAMGVQEPMWAVSLHGFFAGGGMYWEESRYLAEGLGWRVLAPSLPGFGGSDPLPWSKVNIYEMAGQVALLMDHLGIDKALLMGHSMGGAIAVAFAEQHPERTLGIIYRDGAATPGWRRRNGLIVDVIKPFAPDVANVADLVAALVADLPDMLIGRRRTETIRALVPDFRRNVRSLGRTIPVGAMLFTIDMTADIRNLAENGEIPILPAWGCFDRIAHAATAREFEEASGKKVLWVPGGHSWMLARPNAQLDILTRLARGRAFAGEVMERRALLAPRGPADRGSGSASQLSRQVEQGLESPGGNQIG